MGERGTAGRFTGERGVTVLTPHMLLAEFHSKPLTTKADGAAVVTHVPFDEVCAYIADGSDTKVANLLAGLWVSRAVFTKEQMLNAAVCALFPDKGYMRRTTSSSAMMLAKAIGCERELQKIITERWVSIRERECNEVVLGLSGNKDVAGWMPVLPVLFDLNKNNDVRTQLVRAANNIVRATESPEARRLLDDLLRRMPTTMEAYSNPNNFQFISGLQAPLSPR
jgi:hypothetical protein